MEPLKVNVICQRCGATAPMTPPDESNPFGVFHWHQPCPHCGAERWAAHEIGRDWKTGKWITVEK